jgi:hypothetical protein
MVWVYLNTLGKTGLPSIHNMVLQSNNMPAVQHSE